MFESIDLRVWFLQGAAIVQLCPVLCFADCTRLVSGSLFWEAVGTIVLIFGFTIAGLSVRRIRNP